MLDGCGIETSHRGTPTGRRGARRDRCSMAVGSRRDPPRDAGAPRYRSRSMLDGCGIETTVSFRGVLGSLRSRSMLDGCGIETRDQDLELRSESSRSRSMLDGCGIETEPIDAALRRIMRRNRCSMAVESRRTVLGRAQVRSAASRSMLDGCGIETHGVWRRRVLARRASRSMLDGCGIETRTSPSPPMSFSRRSQSMLDGCGIETATLCRARGGLSPVAIDARWLWNRDTVYG